MSLPHMRSMLGLDLIFQVEATSTANKSTTGIISPAQTTMLQMRKLRYFASLGTTNTGRTGYDTHCFLDIHPVTVWANSIFSQQVDGEKGNYDYLMFADLDYSHPEVKSDVKAWGAWIGNQIPLQGMRFDAIKHFSVDFLKEFIESLDKQFGTGTLRSFTHVSCCCTTDSYMSLGWFLVGEVRTNLRDLTHSRLIIAIVLERFFGGYVPISDGDVTQVFIV